MRIVHLILARNLHHCEEPPAESTSDPKQVTCKRCLTVIEFYRPSVDYCMRFGFNEQRDVKTTRVLIQQARVVADPFQQTMIDAMEVTLNDTNRPPKGGFSFG